ncbi:MAG: inositol monophosphatase family protein [bacterium]|nr:inositol monophosphatase family protein [bacterium]
MNETLEFAVGLAREAGEIMRQNFKLGMNKEWKVEDNSPVTETDIKINALVMNAVQKKYPTYSFVGEEGSRIIESEYTWVCDPIDGTIPFSHGYPTFVFSLALTRNGESILGVIYDPIMDRLLHAEKGKGAFLNGSKISVSKDTQFTKRLFIETGGNSMLPSLENVLANEGCRTVSFYSCVYAAMLIASGQLAAGVYKADRPWDAAAVKIIVEEAGGKVTDLEGKEQRYDQKINGFIASNGRVHQQLVDLIRPLLK